MLEADDWRVAIRSLNKQTDATRCRGWRMLGDTARPPFGVTCCSRLAGASVEGRLLCAGGVEATADRCVGSGDEGGGGDAREPIQEESGEGGSGRCGVDWGREMKCEGGDLGVGVEVWFEPREGRADGVMMRWGALARDGTNVWRARRRVV